MLFSTVCQTKPLFSQFKPLRNQKNAFDGTGNIGKERGAGGFVEGVSRVDAHFQQDFQLSQGSIEKLKYRKLFRN